MTAHTQGAAPARIFVSGEPQDAAAAEVFTAIRARGGEPVTMHRALAAAPKVLAAVYNLAVTLRHTTSMSRVIGELIILRTVQLEGGHYEFAAHKRLALQLGLTEAHVSSLDDWRNATIFTSKERAVLAYADALATRKDVPDEVFEALRAHFSDKEIIELTVTTGFYVLATRFSSGVKMKIEH